MSESHAVILGCFLSVVLLVGLFFLMRALLLWYWRVNESILLQHKILKELMEIRKRMPEKEKDANDASLTM